MKILGASSFFVLCVVAVVVLAGVVSGGRVLRLAYKAENANSGEFPYIVSLQFDKKHYCGGTLISKTHVLTAAHCVEDFLDVRNPKVLKKLTVEVGSNKIGGGKTYEVKRLSQKRDYDMSIFSPYVNQNDIGVITLKTPVNISDDKLAKLPTAKTNVTAGSEVTVMGFGNKVFNGPTSPVLQKSKLKVLSQAECSEYYTDVMYKKVSSSHYCAKRGVGYGVCQGDSGSAMIQNKQVVGIVSAGDGYCGSGSPDVFTKVSSFLPYINYEMSYDFKKKKSSLGSGPAKAVNVDDLKDIPAEDLYRIRPHIILLLPPRGGGFYSPFFFRSPQFDPRPFAYKY